MGWRLVREFARMNPNLFDGHLTASSRVRKPSLSLACIRTSKAPKCSMFGVRMKLWQFQPMSKAIDQSQCINLLKSLDGWEIVNGELVKVFSFGSYLDGLEFAKRCGELAEEMNHHPDLLIQWRQVRVSLVTHSAGGLTDLDFEYAGKVENFEQ